MRTDLLKEWHTRMSEYYWANADFQKMEENCLSNLKAFYDVFKAFFLEETLLIDLNNPQLRLNWLQDYLNMRDPRFIGYARVMSAVIDYYYTFENEQFLKVQPKDANIDRLRDILFEWYLNFVLRQNGIKTDVKAKYVDGDKNKPLDSFFKFDAEDYIIECAKVYDSKRSTLFNAVKSVIYKVLTKKGKMVEMKEHLQPCGYIILKDFSDPTRLCRNIHDNFDRLFKEYILNMNASDGKIITYVKEENDLYELFIGSIFFYKFTGKSREFKGRNIFMIFQCIDNPNNRLLKKFHIDAIYKREIEDVNKLIEERIERKSSQHKNAPSHLIIFLEFEQSMTFYNTDMVFEIDLNNYDFAPFQKYIKDNRSVFFISKSYKEYRMHHQRRFLHKETFNNDLANKLLNLKWPS